MNKRSNKKTADSTGVWVTEELVIVNDNQYTLKDSREQSIFLCEEDISDEELMAMIAGQKYI